MYLWLLRKRILLDFYSMESTLYHVTKTSIKAVRGLDIVNIVNFQDYLSELWQIIRLL